MFLYAKYACSLLEERKQQENKNDLTLILLTWRIG